MAPHRLPAVADASALPSDVTPPDFWSRPKANFQVTTLQCIFSAQIFDDDHLTQTLEQAQRAFDHPYLLHSFFNKMDEMLNLIEANVATSDFSTNLARQMVYPLFDRWRIFNLLRIQTSKPPYFTQRTPTVTTPCDKQLLPQIDHCTVTIFCYGETGSGKSTLIRNLTKDPSAITSHTVPGTETDTHCLFKSGYFSWTVAPPAATIWHGRRDAR